MQKAETDKHAISPKLFAILYLVVVCGVFAGWWAVVTWWTNQNQPVGGGTVFFDHFQVVSATFLGTSPNYTGINMSIQNTGAHPWAVSSPAQVNSARNVTVAATGTGGTLTCAPGKTIYIKLTYSATSGNQYSILVLLTDGTEITYVATAP